MYRLMNVLLICFLFGCSGYQEQFKVTVEAGSVDRTATPVFVDVSLPAVDANMVASVLEGGNRYPAQIENMGNAVARIWWIVDELAAGSNREYLIEVGTKADARAFLWHDQPGQYLDLKIAERPVLRYMYTAYDSQNLDETWNPYHHVFSPDGTEIITKGSGGRYPHHRGIFFGYTKVVVGDSSYNIWADSKGEHSLHKTVLHEETGQVFGGHVLEIVWNDRQGNPIISETRTIRAFAQPADQVLLDFETELRTLSGTITLTGDRQHAGVQFRARNEVAESEEGTTFLRPAAWADLPADEAINDETHRDLPWNAMQFNLGGEKRYTVAYLSAPDNPDGADFSERKYGRFGEFIPWQLTENNPLALHYRFCVTDNNDVNRDIIQGRYMDLAEPPVVMLVSD